MSALPEYGDAETLYVIDLSAFVHKFWHVGPSFAGRNFAGMLDKMIKSRGPARLAIAEDTVFPTFRHELMRGTAREYKANRPDVGGAERASKLEQLRIAGELAEDVHGVRRFFSVGFEADDVIATLATWGLEEGLKVVVVALDKDMMQLIRPGIVMWDGKGPGLGDEHVVEKLGVKPSQVVDYLAMVGDASDNVPGIAGIGEKGAVKVLSYFGALDRAIAEANAEGPARGANHPFFIREARLWAKLVASGPAAERARKLIRLVRDVPLKLRSLDELRLS